MPELLDRRVLGAVRFVDATTANRIVDGLVVESPQADLRQNRAGLWVVWNASTLDAHTIAFEAPPAAPPVSSVLATLTISDRTGRYVARQASIRLPRDPDPTHPDPLFQPIDVSLYRAPNAPVSPGWAVIRAHVQNAATNAPLGGALLRVVRASDQTVLARGMSDDRGEALVAVPGIPITTFNADDGGAPLSGEIDVTVDVRFDPAAGATPDPDAMEAHDSLPAASTSKKVAAGRELVAAFTIAVP